MNTVSEAYQEPPALKFPTGVAMAVLLAAAIGLLSLGLANIYSAIDTGFRAAITLNSGIGPYSGKEVFLFAGWFGSWMVLHFALRRREVNVKKWFGVFMGLMFVATLLVWPPVVAGIADAFMGG